MHFSAQALKTKKTTPRENLLCFRKRKTPKNPDISENGNSKKKFLYFRR